MVVGFQLSKFYDSFQFGWGAGGGGWGGVGDRVRTVKVKTSRGRKTTAMLKPTTNTSN